jgi:hypothetical protein
MSLEMVHTSPVVDELVTDEGSVVLISTPNGHRVVRLSLLGQLIRELAVGGIAIEDLRRELEAQLGAPRRGDTLALVRGAVEVLRSDGIVTTQGEPVP